FWSSSVAEAVGEAVGDESSESCPSPFDLPQSLLAMSETALPWSAPCLLLSWAIAETFAPWLPSGTGQLIDGLGVAESVADGVSLGETLSLGDCDVVGVVESVGAGVVVTGTLVGDVVVSVGEALVVVGAGVLALSVTDDETLVVGSAPGRSLPTSPVAA